MSPTRIVVTVKVVLVLAALSAVAVQTGRRRAGLELTRWTPLADLLGADPVGHRPPEQRHPDHEHDVPSR